MANNLPPPNPPPSGNQSTSHLVATFAGAFAAVLVLALIGLVIYLGIAFFGASGGHGAGKNLLLSPAGWQIGAEPAKQLEAGDQGDIGWWDRTFHLPKLDAVQDYLKNQGLDVTDIDAVHYQDSKDDTTVTYAVHAKTSARLVHLGKIGWQTQTPDLQRFAPILVFNDGLPAGTMWNTMNTRVVAQPGTALQFLWAVHYDKPDRQVTTDRLPFSDDVFTEQQVGDFQTESTNVEKQVNDLVQQIDDQVQTDTNAKLAQVPANPPRPGMVSGRWGGDGSGEPTKSAERIGGGTVAGAAGGAAFGAAAGDAGLGAGIGAGIGLLGGAIYDGVSKHNDRERYQRRVAAENDERLDNWRGQIRALDRQRDQIKRDGAAEKEQQLADLANRIKSAGGRLDNVASAAAPVPANAPPVDSGISEATPPGAMPNANTPSGPAAIPTPNSNQ